MTEEYRDKSFAYKDPEIPDEELFAALDKIAEKTDTAEPAPEEPSVRSDVSEAIAEDSLEHTPDDEGLTDAEKLILEEERRGAELPED
jgi:predicted transcriptional regulator